MTLELILTVVALIPLAALAGLAWRAYLRRFANRLLREVPRGTSFEIPNETWFDAVRLRGLVKAGYLEEAPMGGYIRPSDLTKNLRK